MENLQISMANIFNGKSAYYQQIGNLFSDADTSKLVINQAVIRRQINRLKELLPQCEHHYAVKAGPHKAIVQEINACGEYFDIASYGELMLLKDCNIPVANIIHTHPIKTISEITACIKAGVSVFVVDSLQELQKFESFKDKVRLLVRVSFCNDEATIQLSSKFGMPADEAKTFIFNAFLDGYSIEGISFHVGSQMKGNLAFVNAIDTCKSIYWELRNMGLHLRILDIGGGFPCGLSHENEQTFFEPISNALNDFLDNVRFFTEPGRYVVTEAATLVTNVIGKKQKAEASVYYINDSIYNSLSNKVFDMFDHVQLYFPNTNTDTLIPAMVYGNTCDSLDKIYEEVLLPNLELGEQILFTNMGAYTFASKTEFNMLEKTAVKIIDVEL